MDSWSLSDNLFGPDLGWDINDFEIYNYHYFLDNVTSKEQLVAGLKELRMFATDALEVAEQMNDVDFSNFKLALAYERMIARSGGAYESKILDKHLPLLFPSKFNCALPLADRCQVPLGVALLQIERRGGK